MYQKKYDVNKRISTKAKRTEREYKRNINIFSFTAIYKVLKKPIYYSKANRLRMRQEHYTILDI